MTRHDRSTADWVHLPPAELVAAVAVAPPPEIAVASLRSVVTAVHDDRGRLADWRLDLAQVFEQDADAALVPTFRAWRHTWVREWPIGPITNATSLRDESAALDALDDHVLADHVLADLLDDVARTGGAGSTIEPELIGPVQHELDTVRLALSVDERQGHGIVDDMPSGSRSTGLARTWAPPRTEELFAATPATSVLLHPDDGLVVVQGREDRATPFVGVTAVDMRGDAVVVLNERGASLRLTQSDARPLGWIVPRSLRWHVRRIPLVAVWSNAFAGLSAALGAAADRDVPVRVTAVPSPLPASGRREFLGP
jgi:hypothetical protein